MTIQLPRHENCGGKLVLPTVVYKNEQNETVSEKTVNENTEYRWCVRCHRQVLVKVVQK